MQQITVSKSQFKAQALEYFRGVEKNKQPIIVTHAGKPVAKVIPYQKSTPEELLQSLRGTVLKYENPAEPVALGDWEALK
jgi:prevent-host-death family protein